ncbi:carbon-nitrogen hydrolase family protein [Pelagibius sp.]|uniref:carbon-nitrogen hydrolase family protein n=1 Tax=Pelagibius sp. TaxID=1931238 RepID=UPI003BAF6AE8
MRKLRVAAVQAVSLDGEIARNLSHVEPLVAEAAKDGAELILLPELYPTGFRMTTEIWEAAETSAGPTVRWLRATAQRLGVWIGTSFLEAEAGHFYNSFVLAAPDGELAGRVRKSTPAAVESYFYRAGSDPHVIDTPLGRIGVSICYEQMLSTVVQELQAAKIDLLLMPHSVPRPTAQRGFTESDVERMLDLVRLGPPWLAETLGVPVVMANKAGPWKTPLPFIFPAEDTIYCGLSGIFDAKGGTLKRLGEAEGTAIADVWLRPDRDQQPLPKLSGHWSRPMPWFTTLWRLVESLGGLHYRFSKARKRAAGQGQQDSPE